MDNTKNLRIVVTAVVITIIVILALGNDNQDRADNLNTPVSSFKTDVNSELSSMLEVLARLHHISVVDVAPESPDEMIIIELQEAMNDMHKLDGLQHRIEPLVQSPDEIIKTTAMVIEVTRLALIEAYNNWIQYLREFDLYDIDVSEFQYQLALFQSSTHDAYLQLVEGASLLPFIAVEFAENEGEENVVKDQIMTHFISEIDRLFSDIFVDNENFYQETGNRYAVAFLVEGYKDFFSSFSGEQ